MSATLALERPRADEPNVLPLALTVAIGAHVALALLTPARLAARPTEPPPLEVELAPARPAPPPPAVPTNEPARPEPAAKIAKAPPPKAAARAPAGKLVAAEGPTADTDAPLDFVTDPNGASYGFGVVSRGGTAVGEGTKPPVTRAPVPVVAPSPIAAALVPAADLSEKPHLLVEDPCRGYYPAGASADAASAVVRVTLEPTGRVRDVQVLSETPAGEGFGNAARSCLRQQRFSSARDREGRGVATATTIRVRFER